MHARRWFGRSTKAVITNGVAAWLGDFGENGLLISVLYQVKIECSLFALNAAISVICNELRALYNEETKRHMNN